MPGRKIWKLHQQSVKEDYSSYTNKYRESSHKYDSVVGYWNLPKETLLKATDKSYEFTINPTAFSPMGGLNAYTRKKTFTKSATR